MIPVVAAAPDVNVEQLGIYGNIPKAISVMLAVDALATFVRAFALARPPHGSSRGRRCCSGGRPAPATVR